MHRVFLHADASMQLKSMLAELDPAAKGELMRALRDLYNRLAIAPWNEGESRPDGRRITFQLPLAMLFRVVRHPPEVYVLDIWRVGRSSL